MNHKEGDLGIVKSLQLQFTLLFKISEIAIRNSNLGFKGMWRDLCGPSIWLGTYVYVYGKVSSHEGTQKKVGHMSRWDWAMWSKYRCEWWPNYSLNDHTLQKQIRSVILFQDTMGELIRDTKWHIDYCKIVLNDWVVNLWKFNPSCLLIKVRGLIVCTSNSSQIYRRKIYFIMKIETIIQFSIVGVV